MPDIAVAWKPRSLALMRPVCPATAPNQPERYSSQPRPITSGSWRTVAEQVNCFTRSGDIVETIRVVRGDWYWSQGEQVCIMRLFPPN
jgi:hypothetical protein